jgi:S-adenosylmethionine hydrolase
MISRVRPFVVFLLACALITGCSKSPAQQEAAARAASAQATSRPAIVFMTDFGTANDAVAICKAVIIGIAPEARILDITHQVTPFQIEEGARFLAGVTPYYPAGTVFLTVVDPGVGTSRKAVIVKSRKGQYFVLPDNGLVTLVLDRDGLESAREITNPAWMIQAAVSSTFHGRDIFSPAAAHLATGWDFNLVGKLTIQINKKPVTLPYVKTFMDVSVGDSLLYIDSRGRVGIANNEGNYAKKFDITPPGTIFIPRKGVPFKGK